MNSAVPFTGSTPSFTDGDAYTIVVGATDAATNPSAPVVDSLIIDTSEPEAPVITSGDLQNTPIISGAAETGSTVTIEVDTDDDGSPDVTYEVIVTDGTWSVDLANDPPTTGATPTLTDGDYGVIVTATDRAGNTGNSITQTFTLDQTPPATPTSEPSVDGTGDGSTGDGSTTNDTTPTIGDGADIFVLELGKGFARIRDFEVGTDKLGIPKGQISLGSLRVEAFQGNNTLIYSGDDLVAGLEKIAPNQLSRRDVVKVDLESLG